MLVLSRKTGESLQIGRNVKIIITQIKGNRVKIGIEAPTDVHIRRSELPAMLDELEDSLEIHSDDESDVTCSAA